MKNYLVVVLPVIDYLEYCSCEQRLKLYEEIDELYEEAESGELNIRKLLSKYMDVGQTIASLIRSKAKEKLAGQAIDNLILDIFERTNTDHLKKMEQYAEERGWAILSGNRAEPSISTGSAFEMRNYTS